MTRRWAEYDNNMTRRWGGEENEMRSRREWDEEQTRKWWGGDGKEMRSWGWEMEALRRRGGGGEEYIKTRPRRPGFKGPPIEFLIIFFCISGNFLAIFAITWYFFPSSFVPKFLCSQVPLFPSSFIPRKLPEIQKNIIKNSIGWPLNPGLLGLVYSTRLFTRLCVTGAGIDTAYSH